MRSFLLATMLTISLLGSPALADNLKFVADIDFAPYSMISEGQPAGIDLEVLNEAARRGGLTIDIEFKPWSELISMVQKGTCDGAFALFMDPEREKYALFMEASPIHFSDYALFTKVGNKFSFRTYDDLAGKTIGRIAGNTLSDEFEAALTAGKMQVKEYPSLADGLRGLLDDEIDAYAGNLDVMYRRLKTMGMTSSIVYLPKMIVSQKPAYMVMSRASKVADKEEIMQRLERALDQMRKDGTYNKIARRYLLRY